MEKKEGQKYVHEEELPAQFKTLQLPFQRASVRTSRPRQQSQPNFNGLKVVSALSIVDLSAARTPKL